ncbi:hypothetical protein TRVL_07928 [Trypanosoma vivax]|nr:hypothetical protein TRVL_07928 [Trypanosoma vivax]
MRPIPAFTAFWNFVTLQNTTINALVVCSNTPNTSRHFYKLCQGIIQPAFYFGKNIGFKAFSYANMRHLRVPSHSTIFFLSRFVLVNSVSHAFLIISLIVLWIVQIFALGFRWATYARDRPHICNSRLYISVSAL